MRARPKALRNSYLVPGGRRCLKTLAAGSLAAALLAACEATAPDRAAETGATPQAALPDVEVDDDPQRLIGLGPNGLNSLLGQPALIRREPPAEIWQYRDGACVFDVVLYDQYEGQRVTYTEARDSLGNRTEPRPCLNGLLRARLTGASG